MLGSQPIENDSPLFHIDGYLTIDSPVLLERFPGF